MNSKLLAVVYISMLTICVIPMVHSTTLFVSNHNFEFPNLNDGVITTGVVPDWIKTGNGNNGTYNPKGNQWYATTDDEDTATNGGIFGTMDGPRVGFLFNSSTGAFSQELSDTLAVGMKYTLTVAVGQRDGNGIPTLNGPFGGYIIELLSDGNSLANISSNTAPGSAGTFEDISLDYIANGSDPIGKIGIRIGVKNFGHLDFDNVRLNVSAVPLPASVWLFGSSLLCLITMAKRKVLKSTLEF